MTFNNLFFVFLFLPVALIVNTILPFFAKNLFLVIVSFVFYSWLDPASLILLLISICFDYVSGLQMEKKKTQTNLIIGIVFHVGILCIYRYIHLLPFVKTTLSMPIGLSFITLSSISYLVDVYFDKTKVQKNWIHLALYISFFGKLSMGPVVQYAKMENQLSKRHFDIDQTMDGVRLFIKGLAKKVVFANQLGIAYAGVNGNTSMLGAWVLALSFMLQMYFELSGYSDMAIGLSKCFGFEFETNFNHPYMAINVQDYWKRWFISLSSWFKEYIYIPLGGSKGSNAAYIRNVFITWLCVSIWLGAGFNMILWSLYFATLIVVEKIFLKDILSKTPSWIHHVYTIVVVLISWILFFSPSLSTAILNIVHLFGIGVKGIWNKKALYYFFTSFIYILLGIVFSMPIVDILENNILRFKKGGTIVLTVLYGLVFLICVSFLIQASSQSFLLFSF